MAAKTTSARPPAVTRTASRKPSAIAGIARTIPVETSTGNVFADLGLPDAAERMAKAMLSRILQDQVRELGWTQRVAATALGIATSDMSDLMRGKLARFSQERLERMLNALDLDVVIHVGPKPVWKAAADVTVTRVRSFAP